MGFTLHLVLMGIVALVADVPNNRLTILIPDLTEPHFASDGTPIPLHRPLIAYFCGDVVGGACAPADQMPKAVESLYETWNEPLDDSGELAKYGVRTLSNVELTISDQDGKQDLKGVNLADVADFAIFGPDPANANAIVEPSFLSPVDLVKAPYGDLLAARIGLSGVDAAVTGWVGSQKVKFEFQPLDSNFAINNPTTTIKLADMVTVDIQIKTTSTKLSVTPWGTTTPRALVSLSPAAQSSELTVYMMNMAVCEKWLGTTATKRDCKEGRPHNGSHHFEAYYDLLARRLPTHTQRVPKVAGSKGGNLGGRPICPQAQLSPR